MNADQTNKIIELLEEIKKHLENIENNTSNISSIDIDTSRLVEDLRSIKNNLR